MHVTIDVDVPRILFRCGLMFALFVLLCLRLLLLWLVCAFKCSHVSVYFPNRTTIVTCLRLAVSSHLIRTIFFRPVETLHQSIYQCHHRLTFPSPIQLKSPFKSPFSSLQNGQSNKIPHMSHYTATCICQSIDRSANRPPSFQNVVHSQPRIHVIVTSCHFVPTFHPFSYRQNSSEAVRLFAWHVLA